MLTERPLLQLRCLKTGTPLKKGSTSVCQRVNALIAAGTLRNGMNLVVKNQIDGGLVNADHSWLYPVYSGIPQLLRDEAIPLRQLEEYERENHLQKDH